MIPIPNKNQINKWLIRWDSLENYVDQERSLKKLFTKTYPKNKSMDEVLVKVCTLNDFYSTNIFSPFFVAKHIVSLDIDKALKAGDFDLVNKIARVTVSGGKVKNFYSFASKYCSHHYPTKYPIYDSYVEKVLMHFQKNDKFSDFKRADLKDYGTFLRVLRDFRCHYNLNEFNLKELDKYLWQLGKHFYPNRY